MKLWHLPVFSSPQNNQVNNSSNIARNLGKGKAPFGHKCSAGLARAEADEHIRNGIADVEN